VALVMMLAVLAPGGVAQICGDCNSDHQVNVVDALVAAQHDVGLLTLPPADFLSCNVDGTPGGPPAGAVTITDALAIAQVSVGLGGPLACVTMPGCTITEPWHPLPTGVLLIEWFAIDSQSTSVELVADWSTDLGITWTPATEGPGGDGTTALASSPFPGTRHLYAWDSVADGVGLTGPVTTRFRFTVTHVLGSTACYSLGVCVDNSMSQATGTWTEIIPDPPLAPPPRYGHGMVYDPIRGRMIMYGGGTSLLESLGDVWAFDLATSSWSQLTPAGTPPVTRMFFATVFDDHANRMVVYGGHHAEPTAIYWPGDTWELDFSGGADGAWQELLPAHPGAEGYIFNLAAVLHSTATAHEMVILGGRTDPIEHFSSPMRVAALDLTPGLEDWRAIPTAAGAAPLLYSSNALIHDPTVDRLVSVGGYIHGTGPEVGLIEFAFVPGGGAWRTLDPCGHPGVLPQVSPLASDTLRNRGVQFSGVDDSVPGPAGFDLPQGTLAVDLNDPECQMIGVQTSGGPPPSRFWHTFVYDPTQDRVILFAGVHPAQPTQVPLDDTWELRF
jgi:hypothetical protein